VPPKTNAARALDRWGISYELRSYPWSADRLDAEHVAQALSLPPEAVWKTLVSRTDRREVLLTCLPGPEQLDLKALATAAGCRRCELVPVKEIQALTGYVRGGVSPLGAKKPYRTFLHATLPALPRVSISAGQRGLQILLAGADLVRATGGTLAEVILK
jgi:Cys-tRNA(Pro)/Cys-tRNA(Cys) deacylase